MKTAILLVLASLAAAGSAAAGERLTDAAYLRVARCNGLAVGAGVDDSALKATFKDAERFRTPAALGRGQQIFTDAKRVGARNKTQAQAELEGACMAYRATPAATGN